MAITPYATHEDVEDVVAGRDYNFSGSSQPTDEQVNDFCTRITKELNGHLSRAGYATPVTDADALELLKLWCCYGVIPLVEMARTPDEVTGAGRDLAGDYRTMYKEALLTIDNGLLEAPDTSSEGTPGMGSLWQVGESRSEVEEYTEPTIKREDRY